MSSTNTNTNTNTNTSSPKDGPSAAGGGELTVQKTVHTVEVRESAGQEQGQGVVKPIKVVHEIPAKEAKEPAKQE